MSGLEALGLVANVVAVVDLSAKVISWCYRYARDVKNAKSDIERLRNEIKNLQTVTEGVNDLLGSPNGSKLKASKKLLVAVTQAHSLLQTVEKTLSEKRTLSRFGLRALKWPYDSEHLQKLVHKISRSAETLHHGLQIDQTNAILNIDEKAKLNCIPVAEGASSHTDEDDATTCLPNTRVQLQEDIWDWVNNDSSKPVMWLSGSAGTGKSTISLTVARAFEKTGILGASFFFKRTQKDRSSLSKFVSTITVDLAIKIPVAREFILDAIENQNDIFQKVIGEQFDHLILDPLLKSKVGRQNRPIVIVIDALDECEREADIRLLIQLLTRPKIAQLSYLRIFLTSRPELPIRLGFRLADSKSFQLLTLHDVPETVIRTDIMTFLEHHINKIRDEYNASEIAQDRMLNPDWPGPNKIERLLEMSVPLFIFAATVCRFIGDHVYGHPDKQLDEVLRFGTKSQESQPQLDKTYLPVLNRLIAGRPTRQCEQILEKFRLVVGSIILLETPLSKKTLCQILGIQQEVINHLLEGLHSVISIPTTAGLPLRLFHLSFRDFLVDDDKKEDPFWIDRNRVHGNLASRSLMVLEMNLKQNMCDMGDPSHPRRWLDAPKINACISPEVQYCSIYWIHHFEAAGTQLSDSGQVHTFLKAHFLHWLEVLSILGRAYDCIGYVRALQQLSSPLSGKELLEFLHDAEYFIVSDTNAIDTWPLQLYSSLLAFAPSKSKVRAAFTGTMNELVTVQTAADSDWDNSLFVFESAETVKHVAFSPDSTLLATTSDTGNLLVMNVVTGEPVRSIDCGLVEHLVAPVFSPDSLFVLQATLAWFESPIRIWNINTGEQVRDEDLPISKNEAVGEFPPTIVHIETDRYLDRVIWRIKAESCIHARELVTSGKSFTGAISKDSKLISLVLNSENEVYIWDVSLGAIVRSWHVPTNSIISLAFSHDSNLVAVGGEAEKSKDALSVYHVASGELRRRFRVPCKHVLTVAFSHDSKLMAAGDVRGGIHLYCTNTGNRVQYLRVRFYRATSIAFSHDSTLLAVASMLKTIEVFRVVAAAREGAPIDDNDDDDDPRNNNNTRVKMIKASHDLTKIMTLEDTKWRMWSAATGQCMWTFDPENFGLQVYFSPDSAFVFLISETCYRDHYLLCADTGEQHMTFEYQYDEDYNYSEHAFSEDSSLLALTGASRTVGVVSVWNIRTRERIQYLEYPKVRGRTVSFSADAQLIASFDGNVVSIRSIVTGEYQQKSELSSSLEFHHFALFSESFALVVVIRGHELQVRRCDTGDLVQTLPGKTFNTTRMTFIEEPNYLALSCSDGKIRIWDLQANTTVHTIRTSLPSCRSLSFLPEDSRLLTEFGAVNLHNFPPISREFTEVMYSVRSGYGISGDYSWITWNEVNFFYLPINYRPCRVDEFLVSGSKLMIGLVRTGKTIVFNFSNPQPGGKPTVAIRIVDHLSPMPSRT